MTVEKIINSKEYQKLIKFRVKEEFRNEYINYKLGKEHDPRKIRAIRKYIKEQEVKELMGKITFTVEPAKTMTIEARRITTARL